jgi:hypothetical protein
MKAPFLAALIFVALSGPLQGQTRKCGGQSSLIYADSVSFFLEAPAGWTIDCEAGKNDGPITVLYRIGESWRTGEAVMYANVLTLDAAGPKAFQRRIATEVADWKSRVPDAHITVGKTIRTRDGAVAAVRHFSSKEKGLHEAVAYVPRGRVTPLLAMTARSATAFAHALPDFERLVRSYALGPVVTVR